MANQPPVTNGKRKALIIGISKYDHSNKFRDLDFCENDANEVYKILKEQGYDIPVNRLIVGKVDWARMRDALIDFFTDRRLRSEDTLFFYFSGHGYLDKNTGRNYLATSEIDPEWPEMKAIPFEELTTYMNLCNSERITTVLDCCYSGALEITGGKGEGEEEDEESAKSERGEEIASLANTNLDRTVNRLIKSGQGKCILASSLEEQRSFKMEGQPYSTFTYFLIEGLRGAEGGSVDQDGYVTPESLGKYVNKKILELDTIKQKPVRKTDITGEIILAYYPSLAKRQQSPRDYLLHLLTDGRIEEFNEMRRKDNYSRVDFYNVDLSKRDLSNTDLRNVDLNLANLKEAKLHQVVFWKATLSRVHLEGSDLSAAQLSSADLSGANLSGADFLRAVVKYANLLNADLSGANLSLANLSGANLSLANLSGADLREAYLVGANLSRADLSGANLSRADLSGANLSRADLSGANLASSIVIGVRCKGNDSFPLSRDANFDSESIIDDKRLSMHFHNSNAKNVPPAAKDKKELRKKLEKRGLEKENVNEYLSFSSLPD
jgi:uncharacterized protein YjbI with pentapeptide repeats